MDVEFRVLKWAITASQQRSLRQAAGILNVRQSTLSRRLRTLEQQLGSVLFERTNGGTRPTIAGQEFLESAKRIVDEAEAMATRLRMRSRGESGRLSVGVHAALSTGNLRATLVEYHGRCPNVETRLIDGSSDQLISDLMSCAIDVALVVERHARWDGRSLPLWSERVVAALVEDHPLVDHDAIHWRDLRDEALLLPLRGLGPEFHQLLLNKLGNRDLCKIARHDVALDGLLTLVGAGLGISLILEGATGASWPGVVFRVVHDDLGPTRLNFFVYWRQSNGNPSLHAFLDVLRTRYPDLSADVGPG